MDNLVERRLQALEDAVFGGPVSAAGEHAPGERAAAASDPFWVLHGLQERAPEGAVTLAGHAPDLGVEWQYGRPASEVLDANWPERASRFEALGHPVRLRLLQLVLAGTGRTADLAAADGLGTTGQLHHHLRVLRAAGWLTLERRGEYQVPATRVVPLLACLLAAEAP